MWRSFSRLGRLLVRLAQQDSSIKYKVLRRENTNWKYKVQVQELSKIYHNISKTHNHWIHQAISVSSPSPSRVEGMWRKCGGDLRSDRKTRLLARAGVSTQDRHIRWYKMCHPTSPIERQESDAEEFKHSRDSRSDGQAN